MIFKREEAHAIPMGARVRLADGTYAEVKQCFQSNDEEAFFYVTVNGQEGIAFLPFVRPEFFYHNMIVEIL